MVAGEGCVKNIGNLDKRVKNGSGCRKERGWRDKEKRGAGDRAWGALTLKKSGGGRERGSQED